MIGCQNNPHEEINLDLRGVKDRGVANNLLRRSPCYHATQLTVVRPTEFHCGGIVLSMIMEVRNFELNDSDTPQMMSSQQQLLENSFPHLDDKPHQCLQKDHKSPIIPPNTLFNPLQLPIPQIPRCPNPSPPSASTPPPTSPP